MIRLHSDALDFSFPDVHPDASLRIIFQRTLRIPDDDRSYPLPPGLGAFPLRHVDDFGRRVPPKWLEHGGVMLPMYQSEAMWIYFVTSGYPFAVKIATGRINAVTGEEWRDGMNRDPQDYVVVPMQPWLDGYCVRKGEVRQFVAMPLGDGYTAEEQLTGAAEYGGTQILVHPMKREAWKRHEVRWVRSLGDAQGMTFSRVASAASVDMGLAPGGRMEQEIYDDPYRLDEWDLRQRGRCFVHIANSEAWVGITGEKPPTVPPTAKEYTEAGLPWFEYYAADRRVLEGSSVLGKLRSVAQRGKAKRERPLPENEPVDPERVVRLREGLMADQVREGVF